MTDRATAIATLQEVIGCPPDDPTHPWTLREFEHGWLARVGPFEGYKGQSSLVLEPSGRVLSFPSAVPPERIRNEFEAVQRWGKVVAEGGASAGAT